VADVDGKIARYVVSQINEHYYYYYYYYVDSYADYISVNDASNLVRIPESMPLELAAMLPCGGLAAYSAVQRVKPFIHDRLENTNGKR